MIKSAPSSDQRTRYNKAFSFRKLFWAMTAGSDNGTGEVEVISLPLRNAWGEKWSLQLKSNICQVLKLKPYPNLLFLQNHINAFLGVGHLWSFLWILGTRSLSFRWAFFKNVYCWKMSSLPFFIWHNYLSLETFKAVGKFEVILNELSLRRSSGVGFAGLVGNLLSVVILSRLKTKEYWTT